MKTRNVHLSVLGWLGPSLFVVAVVLWFFGVLEFSGGNFDAPQFDLAGWFVGVAAACFVAWLAVSAIVEHFTPREDPVIEDQE